jgi:succinyl-CoA synthetase alpha subunit
MGHAGAIVSGGDDTAESKMKALKECGISVCKSVSEIGETMKNLLK